MFKIIEGKVGGKGTDKVTSTIKPTHASLNEMFKKYQEAIVINDQAILGLEDLDVDLTDFKHFNQLISFLAERHNFNVDETKVNEKRRQLKKLAAEKTLLRLENAVGWVLVQGRFTISNYSDNSYKIVYLHPVNEYLDETSQKITLSVFLMKDTIQPPMVPYYTQSLGSAVPLNVYGKVWRPIDRSSNNWELQITPLVIY